MRSALDSAPGRGRGWRREKAGRDAGWGVRSGERKKKKLGIHGGAAPSGGAAYFARFMERGGERRHSERAPPRRPPAAAAARPRRILFVQSLPLGDARSRLKLLLAGRCGRSCSSSCRTIWLSLRRKSGLTWRLPEHVTAAAATSSGEGEVGRRGPRGREHRGGRGAFRPGYAAAAAIGPRRGENQGKGLGSCLLGGGKRKKKHARFSAAFNGPTVNSITWELFPPAPLLFSC